MFQLQTKRLIEAHRCKFAGAVVYEFSDSHVAGQGGDRHNMSMIGF